MTEYDKETRKQELIENATTVLKPGVAIGELVDRIIELEGILYDVHNDVTKSVVDDDFLPTVSGETYEKIVMALLPVPKLFIPHEDVKDMI